MRERLEKGLEKVADRVVAESFENSKKISLSQLSLLAGGRCCVATKHYQTPYWKSGKGG